MALSIGSRIPGTNTSVGFGPEGVAFADKQRKTLAKTWQTVSQKGDEVVGIPQTQAMRGGGGATQGYNKAQSEASMGRAASIPQQTSTPNNRAASMGGGLGGAAKFGQRPTMGGGAPATPAAGTAANQAAKGEVRMKNALNQASRPNPAMGAAAGGLGGAVSSAGKAFGNIGNSIGRVAGAGSGAMGRLNTSQFAGAGMAMLNRQPSMGGGSTTPAVAQRRSGGTSNPAGMTSPMMNSAKKMGPGGIGSMGSPKPVSPMMNRAKSFGPGGLG